MGATNVFSRSIVKQISGAVLSAVLILGCFAPICAEAETQTFTLQLGWNSIFLEVTPSNPDPAAVFAGIPIDQVWAYFPTRSPVEYLSDPASGLFNVPGWNVWLPSGSRPDAELLTDLKGIIGHQAYLLKNTGNSAVTLTVNGALGLREIRWNPDSFTLTGVSVDSNTTVRSGDFFSSSPAHKGQARYRLSPNGTWTLLADSSPLAAGQAYWIFSKGGSDFSAPLEVKCEGSQTLDFGTDQETRFVTLRNRSAYPTNVTVANPAGFPLRYAQLNTDTGLNEWLPLTTLTRSIAPGASVTLNFGVRRADLTANRAETLGISGGGVAIRLPVSAQLPGNPPAAPAAKVARALAAGVAPAQTTAAAPGTIGLWIGTATLTAVTEANSSDSSGPTATPAEFTFRLLLHVSANGTTRLLKEVTLMKKHVDGNVDPTDPPPFVLVTDPTKLTAYDAPLQRDGSPFAYRTSSVGVDFAGNELALDGTFGGSLSGKMVIGRNLPTNPFKHKYHPDHDDLDAQFLPPPSNLPPSAQEVWEVTRDIELIFAAPAPDNTSLSAGYSERTGTYRETVSGLHKNNIVTQGSFRLRRVSTIGELNPAP